VHVQRSFRSDWVLWLETSRGGLRRLARQGIGVGTYAAMQANLILLGTLFFERC
jgi:hypothetical protein